METATFCLIIFVLWIFVGTWGYLYWWNYEFGEKPRDWFILFAAVGGPLNWITGYFIHHKHPRSRIGSTLIDENNNGPLIIDENVNG